MSRLDGFEAISRNTLLVPEVSSTGRSFVSSSVVDMRVAYGVHDIGGTRRKCFRERRDCGRGGRDS